MKKENSGIIDADLRLKVPSSGRKSAVKVSVPHSDNLIDADEVQLQRFAIRPRVCEDVMFA